MNFYNKDIALSQVRLPHQKSLKDGSLRHLQCSARTSTITPFSSECDHANEPTQRVSSNACLSHESSPASHAAVAEAGLNVTLKRKSF
jgi:hypothetical protein